MIFTETKLKGAFIVELERREDQRGFFARTFCQREFQEHGLNPHVAQCNMSSSKRKGTLRGMHFQAAPYEEAKLVRCTRGAIYDVVVDLRPESPTYKQWAAVELTADNHCMLYIPEDCAHGYQTLVDDTEICYQTSNFYAPDYARGVRYDDPEFRMSWPLPVESISDADRCWPDFQGSAERRSHRKSVER